MKQHSTEKDHNPESLPPVKGRILDPDAKDGDNQIEEDRSIRLLSKVEVDKRMSDRDKQYEEEQVVYRSIQIKGRERKSHPDDENKYHDGRGDEPRYDKSHSPYPDRSPRSRKDGSPYSRSSRHDDRGDYRREPDKRSRNFSEESMDRRRSHTGQNKEVEDEYSKRAAPEVRQRYRDTGDDLNDRREDQTYRSIEIRPKPVKRNESKYETEYSSKRDGLSPDSNHADRRSFRKDSKSPSRYKVQGSSLGHQGRDRIKVRNRSMSESPDRNKYKQQTQDSKNGNTYYQESKTQEINRKRDRPWSRSPVREISINKHSAKKQPRVSRSRSRSTERSISKSKKSQR